MFDTTQNFSLILTGFTIIFGLAISCSSPSPTKPYHYRLIEDQVWGQVDSTELTMDIYVPQSGKKQYSVLVVYHGGGWTINTKSVMDSMSAYVARNSEYIVCNVDYRLLGDRNNTVTMDEIVEDAIGSFLWVKYNIEQYGGDPDQISVTGDSAGGHLAMMVTLAQDRLSSDGFSGGNFGFNPTYYPEGMLLDEISGAESWVTSALLSYGAFDIFSACKRGWESGLGGRGIFGDSINLEDNEDYYRAVSPIYMIPEYSENNLPPMLFTVGSIDKVTAPESIKEFLNALKQKGQKYEYWVYPDMPHAYLDSHMNDFSGKVTEFTKDAPKALDVMIDFLVRSKLK